MANGSLGARGVQLFEVVMNRGEVIAQLYQLRVTHQEFPWLYQVRSRDNDVAPLDTTEFPRAPSGLRGW